MNHNTYLPHIRTCSWYHVIWTTKDLVHRLPFEQRNKLLLYMRSYCESEGIYLDVLNGMSNHIHFLLLLNHQYSLFTLMKEMMEVTEQYLGESGLWEKSFRAYPISPLKIPYVRRHIMRQVHIHRKISLEQELWELEPHGIGAQCLWVGEVVGK